MENYKSEYYNPETFEESEIETKIPVDLVEKVRETFNSIDGYMITPIIIEPDGSSVVIGIMDMSDKTLKYKLSLTQNHEKKQTIIS
jgi:hypothetical protein